MFHARGPAAAKDRSPSDDVVRGTATVLDAADLRPVCTVYSVKGKREAASFVQTYGSSANFTNFSFNTVSYVISSYR